MRINGPLALVLVAAGLAAAPGIAAATETAVPAPLSSARGSDGTQYSLSVRDGVRRPPSGPRVVFEIDVFVPAGPDARGVPRRLDGVRVAGRRAVNLEGRLQCRPRGGGAELLYGTAGPGVGKVVAVLADGSRHVVRRSTHPGIRGRLLHAVVPGSVGLLTLRVYDTDGRLLGQRPFRPATPCRRDPARPAPEGVDRRVADGTVAARLVAAEQRWRAAGLRSYALRYEVRCFCGGPIGPRRVEVRQGRFVRGSVSVEDLFATVRRELEYRPAQMSVTYGVYGVPRTIAVDGDFAVADDEVTYRVTGFRPG